MKLAARNGRASPYGAGGRNACVPSPLYRENGAYHAGRPMNKTQFVRELQRELGDGVWKFSLRTGERVNATEVCRLLGGGGHARAAGATLEGVTQAEAEEKMLNAIARIVPDFKK